MTITGTVNVYASASAISWQLQMRRLAKKTQNLYTKNCLRTDYDYPFFQF